MLLFSKLAIALLVLVCSYGPKIEVLGDRQQELTEPKQPSTPQPTSAFGGRQHGDSTGENQDIYLESMEDIEHVTYLSMRNFNMTDEGLLQSSWLLSSANTIVHKQHQKLASSSTLSADGHNSKDRLALMLESFTSHLRNGHLRRLSIEELEAIVSSLNQTGEAATASNPDGGLAPGYENMKRSEKLSVNLPIDYNEHANSSSNSNDTERAEAAQFEIRCQYLVAIYKFELMERQKSAQQRQSQQQSKVEYESVPLQQQPTLQESQLQVADFQVDTRRMMQLCRLAVKCHSADELVNLLNGPWRDENPAQSQLGRGASSIPTEPAEVSADYKNWAEFRARPKSLRDSMSLSLAKLCPLILFQLHDDDGLCSVRRDDRPPMITVWAFATLFVTIVSFCSLIGLSITPLLGHTSAVDSSTSSLTSEEMPPLTPSQRRHSRTGIPGPNLVYQQQRMINANSQQHRACLTLFEGLAVGSLVGSALFSLIPQAFELQERESNQGFLLKALIIFFGIYLFFCSERLMRIILDTRQQRKKKERLNHRSSNSIPLPSTTADFDHHHQQQQQHLLALHNHSVRQDRLQAMRENELAKSQVKNLSSQPFNNVGVNLSPSFQALVTTASQRNKPASKAAKDKRSASKQCEVADKSGRQQVSGDGDQHIKIGNSRKAIPTRAEQLVKMDSTAQNSAARSVRFPRKRNRQSLDESGERVKNSADSGRSATAAGGHRSKPPVGSTIDGRVEEMSPRDSRVPTSMKSSVSTTTATGGMRNRVRRRKTRHQLLAAKRERRKRLELLLQQQHICSSFDGNPIERRRKTGFAGANLKPVPPEMQDQIGQCYPFSDSSSDESCNSERSSLSDQSIGRYRAPNIDQQQRPVLRYSSGQKPLLQSTIEPTLISGQQKLYLDHHHHHPDPFQRAKMHRADNEACLRPLANPLSGKQDISTVAWMIVLGDGLHNFIDGISIGAAFSESILSGVSISVAVICEEFPHELGDFAVLVSSGMTVRQALGYNFLSACTCYLGMAVGIILGDVNDGASYISALAAGVFLYIALVDMMGELSATLEESSRDSIAKTLKLLLLQNVGIFIGISIIFVLSFIDF